MFLSRCIIPYCRAKVGPTNIAHISISRGLEVGQVPVNPSIQSLTLFLKTPPAVNKPETESQPLSIISIMLELADWFLSNMTYMLLRKVFPRRYIYYVVPTKQPKDRKERKLMRGYAVNKSSTQKFYKAKEKYPKKQFVEWFLTRTTMVDIGCVYRL